MHRTDGRFYLVTGEVQDAKTGKYEIEKRNPRAQRLVDFSNQYSMMVGNTSFKQYKRIYTWTRPDNEGFQIVCVLIQEMFRNCLKNAKALPGIYIHSDNLVLDKSENHRSNNFRNEKLSTGEVKYDVTKGRFVENLELLKFGWNRWKY